MITAFVTEAVLIAVVLFGAESVLRRREIRRWRPLGAWMVDRLQGLTDIGELVYARVADYAKAQYGEYDPAGIDYYRTLVPEALSRRATWDPVEGQSLVEAAIALSARLDDALSRWSPVLIADPRLAEIAGELPDFAYTSRRLVAELSAAHEYVVQNQNAAEWLARGGPIYSASRLVTELREYDKSAEQLARLLIAYRDDRPIVSIYANDDDGETPGDGNPDDRDQRDGEPGAAPSS